MFQTPVEELVAHRSLLAASMLLQTSILLRQDVPRLHLKLHLCLLHHDNGVLFLGADKPLSGAVTKHHTSPLQGEWVRLVLDGCL